MTPFLTLATEQIPRPRREQIVREFLPKLESVRDDVEFDLAIWSLAQRLAVDTEELLRQSGARWAQRSGLLDEVRAQARGKPPIEALELLFSSFESGAEAPLPGMKDFAVAVTSVAEDRVKLDCRGARRCCSFVEGMARALCESFGVSLRYIRQPKRAAHVLITFSCLAAS